MAPRFPRNQRVDRQPTHSRGHQTQPALFFRPEQVFPRLLQNACLRLVPVMHVVRRKEEHMWPFSNARKQSFDRTSPSGSWTLVCPNCGKRYVVGEDSILVSDEDTMEALLQAGAKAILGTQTRKPDLAINKGSLPPPERQKALETVRRIRQDIQQRRPRSWRCYKCRDNAYPSS